MNSDQETHDSFDVCYVVETDDGAMLPYRVNNNNYIVAAESPEDALAYARIASVNHPQRVVRTSRRALMPSLIKGAIAGILYVGQGRNAVLYDNWGQPFFTAHDVVAGSALEAEI